MGISITKDGNYDFWFVNPKTGRRTKKRILRADKTPPKDMREAEKLIAEFRRTVEELDGIRSRERAVLEVAQARQLIASKTHTVDDIIGIFAKSASWPQSEDRRRYAGIVINRFVDWARGKGIDAITDITPETCQEYTDKGLTGLAPNTIKKHLTLLVTAFRAVGKEIGLESNPWDDVRRPAIKTISRSSFTLEQVDKIAGCFETWFEDGDKTYIPPENDEMYVGFIFGVYAGARLKDACLMKWSMIDLERGLITFTPKKTRQSSGVEVTIPIIEGREKTWILKAKDWSDGSGYVCPRLAKAYLDCATLVARRYIKCFTLATGVENRREVEGEKSRSLYGFHSLRHTCASILANAGVDLNVIASLVGHSSTAITQVYTHIAAQRQAEEMRRAFGAGAGIKADIIKIIDGIEDERKLKNILAWLKSI